MIVCCTVLTSCDMDDLSKPQHAKAGLVAYNFRSDWETYSSRKAVVGRQSPMTFSSVHDRCSATENASACTNYPNEFFQ